MLVCHCRRVSDREIRACVRQGASSVRAVSSACGAGTCCGGCLPTIKGILKKEGEENAPVIATERLTATGVFR